MRRRNIDLIIALCFAVAGIVWAFSPAHPILVGVLVALPLVLFFPGYTLTQLLFSKWSTNPRAPAPEDVSSQRQWAINHPFGSQDHLIISSGLSLVIDIILGLLLNLIPVGLQLSSWTLSLGLLTAVCALLALLLRRKSPAREKGAGWHFTFKEWLLLVLAFAVVLLALWLSILRPPQPRPSFTQFWMLQAAQTNKSCAIQFGIRNFEVGPMAYRVQLTNNGVELAAWSSIKLDSQQQWERLVPVGHSKAFIEARLYRLGQENKVYREVHITVTGCGPAATVTPTP